MHQSIATIDSPEFINLQPLDINPLMSSCEIKVLYLGENRNHSYITKEVAAEMAKTLRGAPIVGYYKEEKEDFADHGERVILDDEGVKFECLTKPYGFVAPDAKVWFQKFEDTDDFGNTIEREYLMTTGYLWTEQYEECKVAIEEGRPHSMELDEKTLDGHWSTNNKTGMDFFIINDAIFSKLCILGEDVEPCFEGSSVTAPQVSSSFSLVSDEFKSTLFTMMQELKFALEGGQRMEEEKVEEIVPTTDFSEPELEDSLVREPAAEEEIPAATVEEEAEEKTDEELVDNSEQVDLEENQDSIEVQSNENSFAKKEKKKSGSSKCEKDKDKDEEDMDDEEDDMDDSESDDESDDKKAKSKCDLEQEYETLKANYSALEEKYQSLVEFKNKIDNEKKDALIASFYMLSDEDKADVVKNKANYSLDEIEAKLSVICVRKKVNFDLDNTSKNEEVIEDSPITTFNLDNSIDNTIPAWVSAMIKTQDNRKKI